MQIGSFLRKQPFSHSVICRVLPIEVLTQTIIAVMASEAMISFCGGPHIAVHGTIIIVTLAFAIPVMLMGAPPAIFLTGFQPVMTLTLAPTVCSFTV